MKILLDECVTKRLRRYLPDYEVWRVTQMQWNGLKNGKLMAKAIEHEFDMLLTIDKNLQFQQNLKAYSIAVVVLNALSSSIDDIKILIPLFLSQIEYFEKGKAYIIEPPFFQKL